MHDRRPPPHQKPERLPIAALTALFATLLILVAAWGGFLSLTAAAVCLIVMAAFFTACQSLIHAGLTQRLPDPELKLPQLVVAALGISYLAFEGAAVRPLFILMYLIAFTFAIFTLDLRRLVAMALFYLACYAGVVLFELWLDPSQVRLRREGFRFAFLVLAYAWFVGMGLIVARLRRRLRRVNDQLAEALDRSESLARHDSLTGCLNHRSLMEILDHECARARRGGELSIFFADLDHFKAINDNHGHLAGDEILRQFAEAIRGMLRATDHLGRYGGEEFMVILPQTPLDSAMRLAERIQQAVAALRIPGLPEGKGVTVSIGVARYRAPEDVSAAIARADGAMYAAKRQGRNRVVRAAED